MLRTDEGALLCDFAETYHVYDYRKLPLKTAAAFAAGLPEQSRSRRAMMGTEEPLLSLDTMLQALTVDYLALLVWQNLPAKRRKNRQPESLLKKLTAKKKERETVAFASPEAFEEARQRILQGKA